MRPSPPKHPRNGSAESPPRRAGPAPVRLLILSRTRVHREALATLMRAQTQLGVNVALASTGSSAAELKRFAPEVVLLDAGGAEDRTAARDEIRAVASVAPTVVVGIPEREEEVLACVEAGIAGYVTAEGSVEDLVEAVRCAARGEFRCSPRLAATLIRRLSALSSERAPAPVALSALTVREREIVRLLEQDLSNKEIAGRLCIGVATVKNHVHNLLEKLHVSRRSQAARVAGGFVPETRPAPRLDR